MFLGEGGVIISLLYGIIFYLVIIPSCTLIHEMGHALALLLCTKKEIVKIHIGSGYWDDSNKENIRIGRLRLHFRWGFVGFCSYSKEEEEIKLWKRMIFLLGGPFASFLSGLAMLLVLNQSSFGHSLLQSIMTFFLVQFAVTFIPMKYPNWMGAYGGTPSDGYQVLAMIRNK
ncbi:site-2 protease family protein [Aquibacillus kalidii]|uniref:site-2 protease family protein n=1 Tax=Aquibacillus kalidii TaxID=2762597 RepID=UPI001646D27E|nr:site-2 protease family protein [Aquibacillus kalidii]